MAGDLRCSLARGLCLTIEVVILLPPVAVPSTLWQAENSRFLLQQVLGQHFLLLSTDCRHCGRAIRLVFLNLSRVWYAHLASYRAIHLHLESLDSSHRNSGPFVEVCLAFQRVFRPSHLPHLPDRANGESRTSGHYESVVENGKS